MVEPLQSFLDRKCGREDTSTSEWSKPDIAALRAARQAKLEAEAAAEAERRAAEAEALELGIAAAKVEVGTPEVQGALSRASVRKLAVAEQQLDAVRECYGAGLARTPTLAGKLTINFVITGTGKVGSSVVQESFVRDSAVNNCIAKAIKQVKFPAPRGGGNVIVSLPYELSRRR